MTYLVIQFKNKKEITVNTQTTSTLGIGNIVIITAKKLRKNN